MQSANPCALCKGPHKARRCPELHDPLNDGFYSGGGSHRDHGGDDDEKLEYSIKKLNIFQDSLKTLNPNDIRLCNLLRKSYGGDRQVRDELRA